MISRGSCARYGLALLATLAAIAAPTNDSAAACTLDLSAEPPDVVLDATVFARAQDLGFDAVRIYEFVRNEIEYTPYYGLRKGPVGTLRSRAGNEYDIAALLISLLRVSEDLDADCALDAGEDANGNGSLDGGTRARFVRGRIRVPYSDARDWTGALPDNEPATETGALGVWQNTDPWIPGAPERANETGSAIERLHIWVEAEVQIAQYRGAGAGLTGRAWVALDASFKKREWKATPLLDLGPGGDVEFDYDAYYSSVESRTPMEALDAAIREHLELTPGGAASPPTLLDVDFRGPIVRLAAGVLPNALPYDVLDEPAPRRAESLVALHQSPPAGWTPGSGQAGADDYRWWWVLRVCVPPVSGASCAAGTSLIDERIATAEAEGVRLLVTYPPAVPPLIAPYENGYASCADPKPQVVPVLKRNGEDVATGSTQALCAAQRASIFLEFPAPGATQPVLDPFGNYPAIAGGTYLFALDAGSASSAMTQVSVAQLLAASEQFQVAVPGNPDGVATVCEGNPSVCGPIGLNFDAQDALVGGLLHLVAARHLQLAREGHDRIYSLHHEIPIEAPWAGLVEAIPEVAFAESAPFLVRPNTLAIDLRGFRLASVNRTTGGATSLFTHASTLIAAHISALEHLVWEELANAEAISTVKSFQIRAEQAALESGAPPYHPEKVTSLAEAHALTASCNDSQVTVPLDSIVQGQVSWSEALAPYVCTEIDAATYCRIKELWAPDEEVDPGPVVCNSQNPGSGSCVPILLPSGFQWRAHLWDLYECPCRRSEEDLVSSGGCPNVAGLSAVETRVSKKSSISGYFGWTGHAWEEHYRYNDQAGISREAIAFSIQRDFAAQPAGGGYLLSSDFFSCIADFSCDSLTIDLDPEVFELNLPTLNLVQAGDPVSIVTGNLQHTEVDLAIPGRGGLGLQLKRSYNSRLDYAGPLGYGWVHTYDQHLRFDAGEGGVADDRIVFVDDDGNETPFEDPSPGSAIFLDGPDWYYSTLERKGDSSFELITKEGTVFRFDAMSDNRAKLRSISDRNGNATTLGYDATSRLITVSDPAGRGSLTWAYASDGSGGTYVSVTDWPANQVVPARTWRYRVDAAGDLVSYLDPVQLAAGAAGKPATYSYYQAADGAGVAHNLRCMVMPEDRGTGGSFEQLCGAAAAGRAWTHFVYYANDAVYEHTTSLGETTRFFYDYFRRRTTVTYPDGAEEAYIFDRVGNTIRSESPRGVVHEYVYAPDTRNRLEEIDGFGEKTTAEYDSKGNVTRRIDRLGHEERFTYDSFSNPLTHVDRRGNRREWRYDGHGNLLDELAEVDDTFVVVARHAYDGFGNRVKTTAFAEPGERGARTKTYSYWTDGASLRQVTDPLGHASGIKTDALGRVINVLTERRTPGGQVERLQVSVSYDRNDRVISSTDPGGTISETEFDADGNPIEESEVALQPGQPGSPVQTVTKQYDLGGRLVRISYPPDSRSQQVEYDLRGRVTGTVSAAGRVSSQEYDIDGNRVRAIDPSGAVTTFEYDGDNRPVLARDALGRESRVVYDEEGRVVESWAPGNRLVATTAYDEEGNPVDVWDAANRRTHAVLDELGRARSATLLYGTSNAATTQLRYDLTGGLLERTDPKNHVTRYLYDARGRLVETIDPLGRRSGNSYDEIGDLIETVNGAGERLHFEHDVRGNLTRRAGPGIDDRFTYDARSRLTVARNAERTLHYEYDDANRLVALSDPAKLGTVRQTYGEDDHVVQLVYPTHASDGFPAPGVVTNYQYDANGRLTAILDPAGDWQLEYDAIGRVTYQRGPGGETRKVTYTPEGWLDDVTLRFANGTTEAIGYGNYDAVGQPREIMSGESATPTTVAYHLRGWITSIAYPDGTNEAWTYDKAGNRIVHDPRTGDWVYYDHDAADQLTRIHTVSGTTLEAFGHDGAGRRASYAAGPTTTTYGYDALGRLTSVASPDYALGLFYDANGARVRRTETGQPEARFLGPWVEKRSNQKYRQVAAPGAMGPLGETLGTSDWTYLRDGSGNAIRTTQNGSALDTRRYEAFGRLRNGSAGFLPRGFAGLPTEGSSGLYYANARHYDPRTGRFLQPDPARLYQPNLYAYAANNPVVFGDPTGLAANQSFSGFPDFLGFDFSDPFFGRSGLGDFTRGLQDTFASSFSPLLFGAYDLLGMGDELVNSFASAESFIERAMLGLDNRSGGALSTAIDIGGAISSALTICKTCNAPSLPFMGPSSYLAVGAAVGRVGMGGATAPERLFHYTSTEAADAITKQGLRPGSSGNVFLTPNGGLSPLQAHIDLALPPNRAANALFEVDAGMMRQLGIEIPQATSVGRSYNMPGGGAEVLIRSRVPSQALRRIR